MRIALATIAVWLTAVALVNVAGATTDYVTRGLLCIHRHEGRWNDPGWPYWGGLQMDRNFMKAYGRRFYNRWGTADRWPVWAQLQAGRNGYRARGWSPWPNTARMCGLR